MLKVKIVLTLIIFYLGILVASLSLKDLHHPVADVQVAAAFPSWNPQSVTIYVLEISIVFLNFGDTLKYPNCFYLNQYLMKITCLFPPVSDL